MRQKINIYAMILFQQDKDDELSVATNLYAILRDFDKQKVEYVYSESFETKNVGQAVMNRLIKAAGHKIVKLD